MSPNYYVKNIILNKKVKKLIMIINKFDQIRN